MQTSYALDSYRMHDLSISMRTSSGDTIEMDFSNQQSLSLSHSQNGGGTSNSLSFSSMQSFQFSMDSNGIDEQDKKEIEEFMKIAQPYIDNFLDELKESAPKSPVNQVAREIASIFEPSNERDENSKNQIKTNIVDMFDKSMKELQIPKESEGTNSIEKIFEDAKRLLEKTLKEFEKSNENIYA